MRLNGAAQRRSLVSDARQTKQSVRFTAKSSSSANSVKSRMDKNGVVDVNLFRKKHFPLF